MQNFILSLFLISFSFSETYSWEDGGTILGSYGGNLVDAENVGETDGVTPHDGNYMLTVSESPIDGTPIAYIAWVTDISEGDEITACFHGWDTTQGASPSLRIWGAWSANDDINQYAGAPFEDQQNNDYTAGNGWDQICNTFSTNSGNWDEGEALVIQARLYSSSSGPDPAKYFIDSIEVTTTSNTASIHFPAPVEGLIADAGSNQTVDAGSTVTLDGSGSLNTNGDVAAYFWEQTSGVAVNLDDEESMMPSFTAPNESTTINFDLKVYDSNGSEATDSVTITVIASAGSLTIAEIQGEGDVSPYEDQVVTSNGIVTADAQYGFFIQDSTGPWNGIWIFDFGDNSVNIGDEVEVTGMVEEYNGLTEINITSGSVSIIDYGNSSINPTILSESDMLDESHESVLVTVAGVCNSEPDPQYGEWQLGNYTIQNEIYDFDPIVGESYTITGPVDCYNTQYKVLPRDANDVLEGILSNTELIQDFSIIEAYPNPFNPTISIDFSINESQLVEISVYDLMGQKVDVLYNEFVLKNTINSIVWNANNFSSGEYFIQLKADNDIETKKIMLLK